MLAIGLAPLAPRRAALVLVVGLVAGTLVLLARPFGAPPTGNATSAWFVLNGLLIGATPFAALVVLYWPAFKVPVRPFGLAQGDRLLDGTPGLVIAALLGGLVPVGEFSRERFALAVAAAAAGLLVVGGFLEIHRRLRPVVSADSPPVANGLAQDLVIQWEVIWVATFGLALLIGLRVAGAASSLDFDAVMAALAWLLAYGSTLRVLASKGRASAKWAMGAAALLVVSSLINYGLVGLLAIALATVAVERDRRALLALRPEAGIS